MFRTNNITLAEEIIKQPAEAQENEKKWLNSFFNMIKFLFNWSLLKRFDFFGVSFDFRLENHKKYTSKTGGFWFLMYLIVSIYYSVTSGIKFIFNPTYSTVAYYKNLHTKLFEEHVNIYKENFSFSFIPPKVPNYSDFFEVECTYNLFLRGKNSEINMTNYNFSNHYIKSNNTDRIKSYSNRYFGVPDEIYTYKMKRTGCKADDFIEQRPKNLTAKNLTYEDFGLRKDDVYCFEKNKNFILAGNYYNKYFTFFKIELKINPKYIYDVNTNDIRAASDLKQSLDSIEKKFKVIYPDLFVNYNNFENYDKIIEEYEDYFQFDKLKKIDFFIQRHSFNHDNNLFWANEIKYFYTKIHEIKSKGFPISPNPISYIANNNPSDIEAYFSSNNNTLAQVYIKALTEYPKLKRIRERIYSLTGKISSIFIKNFIIMKLIFLYLNSKKAKNFILNQFLEDNNDDNNNKNKTNYNKPNTHYLELKKLIKENNTEKTELELICKKYMRNLNDNKRSNNTSDSSDIYSKSFTNNDSRNNKQGGLGLENSAVSTELSHVKTFSPNKHKVHFATTQNNLPNLGKNLIDPPSLYNSNFSSKSKNSNFTAKKNLYFEKNADDIINDSHNHSSNYNHNFDDSGLTRINNMQEKAFKLDNPNVNIQGRTNLPYRDNKNAFNLSHNSRESNSDEDKTKTMESNIKEANIKSKISLSRFLSYICTCEWKRILREKKYYDNSEKKFDQFINIKNYMRKCGEIDTLKYILLDENLLCLNNYISRSSILQNSDGKLKQNFEKFFEKNQTNSNIYSLDYEKMKISYSNIKCRYNKTDIEHKLIDLFEYLFDNVATLN